MAVRHDIFSPHTHTSTSIPSIVGASGPIPEFQGSWTASLKGIMSIRGVLVLSNLQTCYREQAGLLL